MNISKYPKIFSNFPGVRSAQGHVYTKHILYPALWLCGIFLFAGSSISIFGPLAIGAGVIFASIIFGFATLAIYFHLVKTDPDRLHSEEYLISQKMIDHDLLGDSSYGASEGETPKMKGQAHETAQVSHDES